MLAIRYLKVQHDFRLGGSWRQEVRSSLSRPEGPSLNTEHSSVVPRVKVPSQRKFHFGTCRPRGGCASQSLDWGASNGREFQNSLIISLFFTVPVAGKNRRFPIIPDAAGGCANPSVARIPLKKHSLINSLINSLLIHCSADTSEFALANSLHLPALPSTAT